MFSFSLMLFCCQCHFLSNSDRSRLATTLSNVSLFNGRLFPLFSHLSTSSSSYAHSLQTAHTFPVKHKKHTLPWICLSSRCSIPLSVLDKRKVFVVVNVLLFDIRHLALLQPLQIPHTNCHHTEPHRRAPYNTTPCRIVDPNEKNVKFTQLVSHKYNTTHKVQKKNRALCDYGQRTGISSRNNRNHRINSR